MRPIRVNDFHRVLARHDRLANNFLVALRPVAKHGWSYRGSRGWRSRVIFNTNMRMAYAAGRWAQAQRLKSRRPYVRYVAVLDGRTRPLHRAWHGTVLHADDAWWRTHAPPNGWNCRCTIQSLSERDLRRFGLQVSPDTPPVRLEPRQVNTPAGPVALDVPEGIDTGFAYNVGDAAWGRGASRVAFETHGEWRGLDAPGGARPVRPAPLPVRTSNTGVGRTVAPGDRAALEGAFRKALGADEVILTDPAGERVRVGAGIVDHILAAPSRQDGREMFFPFIRELIEDPTEIWTGFAQNDVSGRVAMRRRFVSLLQIGKRRVLGVVADFDNGIWSGLTFFRGRQSALQRMRIGLRAYLRRREDPEEP